MDSKKKICACRKLTKRHIEVSGLKKMNVKLAAQVLSHSVAAALNLYVGKEDFDSKASETAQFVYNMDKLFDSVNARSWKHEKKEMCALTENSDNVELWKETIPWIEKWHIRSSKTGKKIYAACKNGWLITLNAFIGISEVLLKKIKFILTGRFSQDALENTFASIRRRGGFRDNPGCNEFRHTIQKVIITNFFKQSINKNCQDDDAYNLIDFSSFNKKELVDIICSEDSASSKKDCAAENVKHVDSLHLNTLDSIEENVLSYIAGYFANKYFSFNDCNECLKLMVDEVKILANHTVLLYFKEYDISKSGLKWPTDHLFQYFVNLHECFSTNFDLFFKRNNISKKFQDVLSKVDIEFFNDHLHHKEKAHFFLFISSFVRMMIRHKIAMKNNDFKPVTKSRKKLKYASHL
ncbi:hypothetical protein AVEN_233616-1 [Araneus ventricosus]|uniref:Transposable element P transposase n=1 Tax=Araneus ventricosus TaxID=182803 RepID=A0A4Y2S5M0_ARAVE|nr:hypothetical protein AVEN_233616-1 [Araneus ventricosus]